MKFLFFICVVFYTTYTFAQSAEDSVIDPGFSGTKPLLLTLNRNNLSERSNSVREYWNVAIPDGSLLHDSNAPILHSSIIPPQTEGTKIGKEISYFLGAAAVAAIIYFLVPDNEPGSKPVYTFGFPVTPK